MTGEPAALALYGPFQVGHFLIAALLKAGHHVLKAAALIAAALPFIVAGTSGADSRRPGLTGSAGSTGPIAASLLSPLRLLLRRIQRLLHRQADFPFLADAEHLDLDRLVLRYKVADFLYKRRGNL